MRPPNKVNPGVIRLERHLLFLAERSLYLGKSRLGDV